jgi:transaldolase
MPEKPKHLKDVLIFLDSSDPDETKRIQDQTGFLDGQTTDPKLIARNPIVVNTGRKFTHEDLWSLYNDIIEEICYYLPSDKTISAQVYSAEHRTSDQMLTEAGIINSWIDNILIKFPCNNEGIEAAHQWSQRGGKINMTLGFNQNQAMATHNATLNNQKGTVYFSVFIGRLIENGIDPFVTITNLKKMCAKNNSHIQILGCSIRSLNHIYTAIQSGCDIITIPYRLIRKWMEDDFRIPNGVITYPGTLIKPLYEELDLNVSYKNYDLNNPYTSKGMQQFAKDWDDLIG